MRVKCVIQSLSPAELNEGDGFCICRGRMGILTSQHTAQVSTDADCKSRCETDDFRMQGRIPIGKAKDSNHDQENFLFVLAGVILRGE
jgi:hypothetical protein